MKSKRILILILLFSAFNLYAADFYWVGGAGNWSDFASHWATTSGGNIYHSNSPTGADDVFFDENSSQNFNDSIIVDVNAVCNNISIDGYNNIYQLASLTAFGKFDLVAGVFVSNGNNLTISQFNSDYFFFRTFDIRNSNLNITGSDTVWRINNQSIQFEQLNSSLILTYAGNDEVYFSSGTELITYVNLISNVENLRFTDNSNFNNLTISAGKNVFIPAINPFGLPLTIVCNNIIANGTCDSPIKIIGEPSDSYPQTIIDGNGGVINCQFVRLQNLSAINGTFNANNSIDLGNNLGWGITEEVSNGNVFWINGSGDWSDATHWSSGCIPGPNDTVIFNALSFSGPSQTVNVDIEAYCSDMVWENVNNPILSGTTNNINIKGSLLLDSNMTSTFSESFNFISQNVNGDSIRTNGVRINSDFNFNSTTGQWFFIDDLYSNAIVRLVQGDLDLLENDFFIDGFISSSTLNRGLDISKSIVNLEGVDSTWVINSLNLTINTDTSEILIAHNLSGRSIIKGGDVSYSVFRIQNIESSLFDDNSFLILEIQPGSSLILESGSNQLVDSMMSDGNCSDVITIESTENFGLEATITKNGFDSLIINYTNLFNVSADTTGMKYYQANNSITQYNTSGWDTLNFSNGMSYYWVNGSGEWSDISHWESPLGTPSVCLPSINDSVFFNAGSFLTLGDSVLVNSDAYFSYMNCLGSDIWNPKFHLIKNLNARKTIILNNTIEVNNSNSNASIRFITDSNNCDFSTSNAQLNCNVVFSGAREIDTLLLNGDLIIDTNLSFKIIGGTFNTNSDSIHAGSFLSQGSAPKTILLNNSSLLIKNVLDYRNSVTLDAGSSKIFFENGLEGGAFYGNSLSFYDLFIKSFAQDSTSKIYGSNTFNDVTFFKGLHVEIEDGQNQQIIGGISAIGNCIDSIFIESLSPGNSTTFNLSNTGDAECVSASDINVLSSNFNALFSTSKSNNTGLWNFSGTPHSTALFSTPYQQCLGDTTTFLNTSNSIIGGISGLTFEWDLGDGTQLTDTSPQHEYLTAEKFYISLKTTYTNFCTDEYEDSIQINHPVGQFNSSDFDTTICEDDLVIFSGISTPSADNFEYFINGISVQSSDTNIFESVLNNSDTITLEVTLNGCTTLTGNEFIFQVDPLPNVILTSSDNDNSICQGDKVVFTASGSDLYQFYIDSVSQTGFTTVDTFFVDNLLDSQYVYVVGKDTLTDCQKEGDSVYQFTVNPNPSPNLVSSDPDNVICDGDTVSFTGSGATNYSFFVNGNIAQASSLDSIYTSDTIQSGDVITVVGESLSCPILSSDNYTVIVNQLPLTTLSSTTGTTICEEDEVIFTASGATSYEFFVDGISLQGPSGLPTFSSDSILNGQNILVRGAANNCFTNSTAQNFTVNSLPIVNLVNDDPDTSICQFDIVNFTTSGTASKYQYLLDGIQIDTFSFSPNYTTDSIVNGQIITVRGELNGCISQSDSQYTFTVLPSFNVSLLTSDVDSTICFGEIIEFTGISSGAINYYLYVDAIIEDSSSSSLFTLDSLSAGSHIISLSAFKNGCTYFAGDSIPILVKPNPLISLTSSDINDTICDGDSVLFIASGGSSYEFIFDSISQGSSSSDSLVKTDISDGQMISVKGYQNGCFSYSNEFEFKVNNIPNVALYSNDIDNIICEKDTIIFNSEGANLYEFFIDSVSQGALSSDSILMLTDIDSNATIYVYGESSGCSLTSLPINLVVNTLPNIFTSISDADTTICEGDLVSISGLGASTYQLMINGVENNTPSIQTSFDISTLGSGDEVTMQGYSINGCFNVSTDTFEFLVNLNPVVSVSSSDIDSVICVGDTVQFSSLGANNYEYFVNGISVDSNQNYQTDSISNGDYITVIGESNGCFSESEPIIFSVFSYPVTTLLSLDSDTTICIGEDILFKGFGAFDYEFLVNSTSVQGPSLIDTFQTNSLADGDVVQLVGSNNGCSSSSNEILVTVVDYPTTSLTSSDLDNVICFGESVTFTAGGANEYEFFVNGISRNSTTATFISDELENNDSIWVLGNNGECFSNSNIGIQMLVNKLPLSITANGTNIICDNESLDYSASGADTYEFLIDGVSVQGPSGQVNYSSSSLTDGQVVSVKGYSNSTGCEQLSQTSHLVTVLEIPVITALSPTDICDGELVEIKSSASKWNQWYKDNSVINGANDTVYFASESGSYQTRTTIGGDNQVTALGSNSYGQYGDSTIINNNLLIVNEYLEDISIIKAGSNHNLAVDITGQLFTWGRNDFGQIGDGTFTSSIHPYQTSITDAIDVEAGHQFSLAVLSDGSIMSWGKNDLGQLGQGNNSTNNFPMAVLSLSDVVKVAAGQNHSMALKTDGTVWAWGDNQFGQLGDSSFIDANSPVQVLSISGIKEINCGANHSMAIDSNNVLFVWGHNSEGQLGLDNVVFSNIPVIHPLINVEKVSGGYTHTLALNTSNRLYSWGNNVNGQLGNGSNINSSTPVLVSSLDAVKGIYTKFNHNFAIKNDNSVWGWGLNNNDQLSDLSLNIQSQPQYLRDLTGSTEIATGEDHSIFLSGISHSCESNLIAVNVNQFSEVIVSLDSMDVLSGDQIGVSYQWYINGVLIPGATSLTYSPSTPGYYSLETTFTGGCVDLSDQYPYMIVGLNEENLGANLRIFPNPALNELNIEITNNKINSINIYTITGKSLYHEMIEDSRSTINISFLDKGCYFIVIHLPNGKYIFKEFVKI